MFYHPQLVIVLIWCFPENSCNQLQARNLHLLQKQLSQRTMERTMTGTLRYKLQIVLTTLKSYHWTEQEFLELWWKSWWFYEIINPRSSRTRTNYMKLDEVINNYYVFCEQFQNIAWFFNVLFSRFKKPLFPFLLSYL